MIRAVAVVVPAHDEERLIGACLEAVGRAAGHRDLRGVRVEVFVAADSCRDATAAVARGLGADVLEISAHSAGTARAAGSALALAGMLASAGQLRAEDVWLANTDADSVVPDGWLADQLAQAAAGWHAVAGTVDVDDWSGHPPGTARYFYHHYRAHRHARHLTVAAHPHVHGANLAVRADAYRAVGGFRPLAVGEDRALVCALEAAGYRVRRSEEHPVVTSGRVRPHSHGGFGELLLAMDRLARSHATGQPADLRRRDLHV
ncbi:glycosyltransferase [Kitasatospora sp. NPDC056138]|uniref:glycosyltransferase n=1 Tax=Kitasatospora sp. NPDC056138 TaxID=3345724 RepID=UPI0035D6E669